MIHVPDAASIATIHFLEKLLNRKCGGSTGTNVYAAFQIISEMAGEGTRGSVVTLICDPGDRYLDTYYNPDWLDREGIRVAPCLEKLNIFYESGALPD